MELTHDTQTVLYQVMEKRVEWSGMMKMSEKGDKESRRKGRMERNEEGKR